MCSKSYANAESVRGWACPPLWRQGGDSLGQPGDRAWRAVPSRPTFRDVVGRLVRTAEGDVAAFGEHGRLRPGQDCGHMLVRGPGLPRQRGGPFVARAAVAESEQRPRVEPERAPLVRVGGQQLLQCAVVALPEQTDGEEIPDPLIVVRV